MKMDWIVYRPRTRQYCRMPSSWRQNSRSIRAIWNDFTVIDCFLLISVMSRVNTAVVIVLLFISFSSVCCATFCFYLFIHHHFIHAWLSSNLLRKSFPVWFYDICFSFHKWMMSLYFDWVVYYIFQLFWHYSKLSMETFARPGLTCRQHKIGWLSGNWEHHTGWTKLK